MKSNPKSKFRIGDSVLVDTHSNLGIVSTTVRDTFITEGNTVDPTPMPALLLNGYSWALESDCIPDTEFDRYLRECAVDNPAVTQLITAARELIEPWNYPTTDKLTVGDKMEIEYTRGMIELITEFAGLPLGDTEPRAAVARAIGIRKEISL